MQRFDVQESSSSCLIFLFYSLIKADAKSKNLMLNKNGCSRNEVLKYKDQGVAHSLYPIVCLGILQKEKGVKKDFLF